uniref:Transmembrane protein 236 n=1 Tax=Astyanax mexicanus TaxID=7994 RepID=W5KIK6_ASTMX
MGSGSRLKFAVCEVLQFAAFCVPLFIVMQRFALILARVKSLAKPSGDSTTAYWLIVALSVAYVTTVAMLVWLPMKYMVFIKKKALVQIRNDIRLDTFAELPVSLVLFSLICIDIVERIRHSIAGGTAVPGIPSNGAVSLLPGNGRGQPYTIAGICPRTGLPTRSFAYAPPYTGPLRFLLASDARADVFADSFMFWLDTAEMVRVASHTPVYFSGWALPVYLFSFLSTLRLVPMPHSSLLSPLGVALQDLPFLFLRVALIAIFGFVTPVLFVMKNLLVCLAYIYFNFMTKLKIFNTERMF